MPRSINPLQISFEIFQYLFCWFAPDEGAGVVIAILDPGVDGFREFLNRGVYAAAQPLGGEFPEPAFHQVHPSAVGGGEMKLETRVFQLPLDHLLGLVRGDVVQHYVHRQVFRDPARL